MPYSVADQLAGRKRKLPFIDIEELVTRPEDIYSEIKADPPRCASRRRRVKEWAETYLRGEPIVLESVLSYGPFEKQTLKPQKRSRRSRAKSVANSVEDVVEPHRGEEVSTSKPAHHIVTNDLIKAKPNVLVESSTVNLQDPEHVVESIEGNNVDLTKPIVIVQGKAVYSHEVVNNHGDQNTLTREVCTWSHDLRLGNQIDRLEETKRPYVQNTPWHRVKIIPPFNPAKAAAAQARTAQDSSKSTLGLLEKWLESSLAAAAQRSASDLVTAPPSDLEARYEPDQPSTPVRQMIKVDSQYLAVAEPPDLQRHQESCQTAELLDNSQMRSGDVHIELQKVLDTDLSVSSSIDNHTNPHLLVQKDKDAASCLRPESGDYEAGTFQRKMGNTKPLIKLKELEEAIDHQLSHTVDQPRHPVATVLVTSSFDKDSIAPEEQTHPGEHSDEPACSASTDRIISSQPEEMAIPILETVPQRRSYQTPNPKIGKTSKRISFEQSSIRKAFQVSKSLEGNPKTPGKNLPVSPTQFKGPDVVSTSTRLGTTSATTNAAETDVQRRASSSSARVQRKGILTYGKRKSQSSMRSMGRDTSFLESVPKSQRELQRAVVEAHGYNYDVGDDFDLDGTVKELGSFLSSWDREKGVIGI